MKRWNKLGDIMAFDFKKEYKDLYLPKKKPSIIRVLK